MAETATVGSTNPTVIKVPPGAYTLTVTPPAGYAGPAPITGLVVASGQELSVSVVETAPLGSLVVTVTDQFGRVVSGTILSVAP